MAEGPPPVAYRRGHSPFRAAPQDPLLQRALPVSGHDPRLPDAHSTSRPARRAHGCRARAALRDGVRGGRWPFARQRALCAAPADGALHVPRLVAAAHRRPGRVDLGARGRGACSRSLPPEAARPRCSPPCSPCSSPPASCSPGWRGSGGWRTTSRARCSWATSTELPSCSSAGSSASCSGSTSTPSKPIGQVVDAVRELGEASGTTVLVSAVALGALLVARFFLPRLPAALVVVLASILVSWAVDLEADGVAVVGAIPSGLPSFSIPRPPLGDTCRSSCRPRSASSSSASPTGSSRREASRASANQHIRANQELLAFSGMSAAAGVTQGFPLGASGSRTAVNDQMGARTQIAGLVAAGAVALVLLFFTEPMSYLPKAVLGAVIVSAAIGLVDRGAWRALRLVSRFELGIAAATLVGVVVLGVLQALVIAVALSILDVVRRSAQPQDAVLGWVDRLGRWGNRGAPPLRARHARESSSTGSTTASSSRTPATSRARTRGASGRPRRAALARLRRRGRLARRCDRARGASRARGRPAAGWDRPRRGSDEAGGLRAGRRGRRRRGDRRGALLPDGPRRGGGLPGARRRSGREPGVSAPRRPPAATPYPSGVAAPAQPDAPPAFHLLAKPTGAVCNLDCAYCFFLSKEMLYPGSRFRMADELLEAYVSQLIEAHGQVPEVMVAWQGGEPTMMGVDFFRRSVELADQYLKPGQRAVYTIQTNGTLLDEEWAGFFREHDFLVGISIDGPREMHDAYRVNKGGRGSFDQVMRGLAHLRDGGVEWNALTTIHAANAEHGREVYCFLRDACGARFVQFIPIIERVAEAADDGTVPWTSWRDRPLYVQQGDRVTGRSVTGRAVRALPDRRVRGVGARRRRRGVRADVRRRLGELVRRAAEPLHPFGDLRARAGARAHRRSLLVRPLRRAEVQARQHQAAPHARPGRLAPAAPVRPRQARHAAPLLPRVRRSLRLPRRLPQGPFHHHTRRRAGAQLPVPRLQGLLPPHRPTDAVR